ncbi:hypothetical protein U9M48_041116 [Paspalum notatum var. saurae]|uniref:Uncharacterized protein n=1 Tax=Paspalum notatum var. saurae TaxID=547442 RepID=A0AAQ3XEG9_PASNO
MATIATMALLKPAARVVARSAPSTSGGSAVSLRVPQAAKKPCVGLASSASPSPASATALAGAFFAALATSDAALAAQRVAEVAAAAPEGGDNRGPAAAHPRRWSPAWAWARLPPPRGWRARPRRPAAAQDLAALAAAAAPADDNRGLLLLIVVAPAIGWVLYNILQPALNQLNRMRND